MCAQLSPNTLVNGARLQDGALATLAPRDLARCISAQTALLYMHTEQLSSLRSSYKATANCKRPLAYSVRCPPNPPVHLVTKDWANRYNILLPSKADTALINGPDSLCSNCIANWESQERATRLRFWAKLPVWFQLEIPGCGGST